MSKVLEGLLYSESHEWVKVEGDIAVIGVSDFAQKEMGNITYVLQGKPALSNDWQNVEFDEPGATNRFFRVKVTW